MMFPSNSMSHSWRYVPEPWTIIFLFFSCGKWTMHMKMIPLCYMAQWPSRVMSAIADVRVLGVHIFFLLFIRTHCYLFIFSLFVLISKIAFTFPWRLDLILTSAPLWDGHKINLSVNNFLSVGYSPTHVSHINSNDDIGTLFNYKHLIISYHLSYLYFFSSISLSRYVSNSI